MNDHPRSQHYAAEYIERLYAPEDAVLVKAREVMEQRGTDWQIGPAEGRMLQVLIAMHQSKKIIEVGTLAGYSTIWMARGLSEGGHIHTLEKQAEHCEIARGLFEEAGVADKITVHEGDASASLAALESGGPYDMIFIDADKRGYGTYLDWAEKHIRKGGVILVDNALLFGAAPQDEPPEGTAPSTWKIMRNVNQRLADTFKYQSIMLPTEQGMGCAVKLF